MKKAGIRVKVTIWYTTLMTFIVALTLSFILIVSESVFETQTQMALVKAVENNVDEIEYDFGFMDIEDDFYFVDDGVYSMVFDKSFVLVDGQYPDGFTTDVEFVSGETRKIRVGSNTYYLYDRLLTADEYGYDDDVWVRGVVRVDRSSSLVMAVMKASFVLLPLLVLIGAAVGSAIARKAFEPVRKITDTVNNISQSGNLTQRVGIGAGNDEIHVLAKTFDEMLDRLEKSFEAEKQFTSDASHELRTPVAVIMAECEMALDTPQTGEEYIESLQVIERQSQKMSTLIEQLLNFTRLEQGVYKPCLEKADLSEVVAAVCEEQEYVNSENDISITSDIQPGIIAEIDVSLISRLVTNLVANAFRYNKPQGSVTVTLERSGDNAVLTVEDTGIGISKEDIEKIWQRFYRADSSRSTRGTGLGLSMVKQIASLHGAAVQVNSEVGKGSVFMVKLKCEH